MAFGGCGAGRQRVVKTDLRIVILSTFMPMTPSVHAAVAVSVRPTFAFRLMEVVLCLYKDSLDLLV